MKRVILFFLLIFASIQFSCENQITEHRKTYDLVCLNDKLSTQTYSRGKFYIFTGTYSSGQSTELEYMFMYKDKYGCISFKRLNANSEYERVFIIEDINRAPQYMQKYYTYSIGGSSATLHYLIVPTGTIASSNAYKLDMQ